MEKCGLSREGFIKYKDYFLKMLEKSGIQDEKQEKSVRQKHDKSFKAILAEGNEMIEFLKQFIGIEVSVQEIEQQKSNFINKQFEKEDDGSNPLIIPVVIYTGVNKWNVKTNFSDTQNVYEGYQEYKINLNYKLIDINNYSKEELIKKDTKLANMMLLEKCKTREELKNEIVEMILMSRDKEKVKWIEQLVKYVFADKLGEEGNKILDILEKGEMSDMEDLLERIEINEARIRRKLIRKGKKQGIIETMTSIIKNMLQQNEDEEKIMKYTNAKKEDIEEAKKQLGMI